MKTYELIKDEKLRRAVKSAYDRYGYKLSFLPSSITGRFHPKDEHGREGLYRHIEKLVWFIEETCKALNMDEHTRDVLLTVAFFHDLGKVTETKVFHQVTYEGTGVKRSTLVSREVRNGDFHPIVSSKLARNFLIAEGVPVEEVDLICSIIERHMGHWYPYLPQPQTELEKLFALADYIVSRAEFSLQKKKRWLPWNK